MLKGHKGDVDSVEFCGGDWSDLVVTCSSQDSTVRMWDLRINKTVRCYASLPGVTHVMSSPSHRLLICATEKGEVALLDAAFSRDSEQKDALVHYLPQGCVYRKQVSHDCINQVAIINNQRSDQSGEEKKSSPEVFFCDDDGYIKTLVEDMSNDNNNKEGKDEEEGKKSFFSCFDLGRHQQPSLALSLSCSRDGSALVSGGTDCTLRLWQKTPPHSSAPFSASRFCVFSPDSQGGGGALCNPPHVLSTAFHEEGHVVTAALGDGRVAFWKPQKKTKKNKKNKQKKNKRKTQKGANGNNAPSSSDCNLPPNCDDVIFLSAHSYSVSHVSFPRHDLLCTASNDASVALWKLPAQITDKTHRTNGTQNLAAEKPFSLWKVGYKPNWTSTRENSILLAHDNVVEILKFE